MANRVQVSGSVRIVDDEFFSDEICHGSFSRTADVSNDQPAELIEYKKGCGGEVRAELHLDVQALKSGDVRIRGKALLYEGTSEHSNDLDGKSDVNIIVPANDFKPHNIRVRSTETAGGDSAKFRLNFMNIHMP